MNTSRAHRGPRLLLLAGGLAIGLSLNACGGGGAAPQGQDRLAFGGQAFGTGWGVIVTLDESASFSEAALRSAVERELVEVDEAMSTWRDDSELMALNRLRPGESLEVGAELSTVLELSREVWSATEGAFEPTVGPLVRAWGFGAGGDAEAATPDDATVASLLAGIGMQHLVLDPDQSSGAPNLVRYLVDGDSPLSFDLSAVAKGFAVDEVATALEREGVTDYFVEIGGEVRVRGRSPRGGDWRVGINRPTETADGANEVELAVEIDAGAVATSGDYRNFRVIEDGRRVAHTIDPRTGRPVDQPPASVTVVAPTCALADAWATALTVLGASEGLPLVEERADLEALFLTRTEDGSLERAGSSGFDELVLEAPR